MLKTKTAWINHVLNLPYIRSLLGVSWKTANNVIRTYTHRSISCLQNSSQSFKNVLHDYKTQILRKSTLFTTFQVFLKGLVIFFYEMCRNIIRFLDFYDFDKIGSWELKSISKNCLIKFQWLLYFFIIKID